MRGPVVIADPAVLSRAAAALRAGELVAFPTETVYGLGADADNTEAVRRIFAAKGRPADHPVIVHLPGSEELERWARDVPAGARRLAETFWPGPLTLILPRARDVQDIVTGGQDRVGLRVPSHPVALALLHAFVAAGGSGIAAPSANRFGEISPTTARHVEHDLGKRIAMIIDGGACTVGIESTIVAFDGDEPTLLRPGGIGIDAIAQVLGRSPRAPGADAPRASGTLASHYAPRTPARLVAAANLPMVAAGDPAAAVLARTAPRPRGHRGAWITAPSSPVNYAHDLYANLRALDASGAGAILIEAVPGNPTWLAVHDRLTRATHGDDDDLT